jgi:hypothetical protein
LAKTGVVYLSLHPSEGRNMTAPLPALRPNTATEEGRELGRQMARLCDTELSGKRDDRCATCAFRSGDHVANGSPETLMTALKCAMEGEVFWCHEHDRACAGWAAFRFPKDKLVKAPWDYVSGTDEPTAQDKS